ncbi:hypothetical protein ACFO4E_10340 [Nocardiopsis mangrovi]|uniref:PIN domain-containing protein n=1 Tax=Nocardiopsis mangrovi TaxID=1179818 RepID=A0ABV9DU51_9ACTN
MIGGKILTASAISAWANGSVYMATLVDIAIDRVITLHVPALALTSGLFGISMKQAESVEARLDDAVFTYGKLDRETAPLVALTATRWRNEGISPADAHVVNVAASHYEGWPIVTAADEAFWARFLPKAPIERLP